MCRIPGRFRKCRGAHHAGDGARDGVHGCDIAVKPASMAFSLWELTCFGGEVRLREELADGRLMMWKRN
jgi:hypothetical protein